jgi:hypothetical protein
MTCGCAELSARFPGADSVHLGTCSSSYSSLVQAAFSMSTPAH